MTQKDLQQIGDLIDLKLKPLQNDMTQVKSDIHGLKSDVSTLKNDMTQVKSDIHHVKKTTNQTLDFLEREQLQNKRRIQKIESHLGLSPIS